MESSQELGHHTSPGNETAIRALVRLLKSTQDDNTRWSAAESLGSNGTGNETAIRILARSLRHSLSSVEAYQLMTTCAEKLPYPEFYQIFHTSR
ncbi:MAG: HEAT repeat domain-containing protein [Leptolyngbyaceae cyanobacterium RU_5_1]|nr:HEAT repeat domain-containing protein [Leptolyngbyaceae cyanobacterium RU_5_1]